VNGSGGYFAGNLDALNDALAGGMVSWTTRDAHSSARTARSKRTALGHDATVRELEDRLNRCHVSNRPRVGAELERARARQGPTVFDWLLEAFEAGPATVVIR
jgi:hypothetical protein